MEPYDVIVNQPVVIDNVSIEKLIKMAIFTHRLLFLACVKFVKKRRMSKPYSLKFSGMGKIH